MTDNPKAKHSERRERLMRQFMNGTTDAVFEEAGQHYDRLGAYADELAAERDELAATLEESIGETVREHDEAEALRAKLQAAERVIADARRLRENHEWNEEDGAALWWALPIVEPPYCGTALDEDFPDYVTHWTKLLEPEALAAYDSLGAGREGGDEPLG